MKKLTVLMVLGVIFYSAVASALPIGLTQDTYWHPNGPLNIDVLGDNPPFQIYGSIWTNASTLQIWTDWSVGLAGTYNSSMMGDVFLQLDTGEVIAVALRNHVATYDFDGSISQGEVFYATNTWTSDDYAALTHWYTYGWHEVVTATGSAVAGVSAAINYHWAGIGQSYIEIELSGITNANLSNYLSIAQTCANDIHKVPEPAALVLVGIGLVGVGICSRKKSHA